MPRSLRSLAILLCTILCYPLGAAAQAAPIEKAWYSPPELLAALAQRDGVRWALPETLAGRALVGGEETGADQLLDTACKQWGLAWRRSNGIVVVHRPNEERLKKLTTTLQRGGREGGEAAWELGWLRDARALPALAEALAGNDVELALAAAQAIEVLDRLIPLGREERVDPLPPGRVSLAAAFPPKADVVPLLDSPYPSLRAAALRLLLGQGGKAAENAQALTAKDRSVAVMLVRQQFFGPPPTAKTATESKLKEQAPVPRDTGAVQAGCAKFVEELPGLAKQSAWESMRWRVRSMAEWSRRGQQPATEALTKLCRTKIQYGWFPGYVQLHLAATGSPEVVATLKELFPKADRAALSRGLEQSFFGNALLAFTRPYLQEQTLCYVTTRKAGREATDDLLALAGRGHFHALDALGAVGGPKAVAALRVQFSKDGPESGTRAFRSAKALGQIGGAGALDVLLAGTQSPARFRRHAATLFLGRVGGPRASARLLDLLVKDPDRLVRAAAADGLEQIGTAESLAAVQKFRRADIGLPSMVYQPRNARFGADFPSNEWVNLKVRIEAHAEFGEMGWNYDLANRLFVRYGGCSGYTNELTVFDLGTEQFVQRRPNEKMAGWGDRRLINGCTAGRCWDPRGKVVWLGPAIGATEPNLAIFEYYNKDGGFRFCSYDLATDRFRPVPQPKYATRYAFDWKTGLLLPVKFTPANHKTKDFWAFDAKNLTWLDKKTAGDYPRDQDHTTAAVDQDTGLLVLYMAPHADRPAETWNYDPSSNQWKNMQPKVQPPGVAGAGFVYDPFHKILLLQSGKKMSQYGGPADSITWSYNARTNTWTDLKPRSGPGNPWVGAMDFDPEHNVFVLFNHRDKQVWAYRYQAVPAGTQLK